MKILKFVIICIVAFVTLSCTIPKTIFNYNQLAKRYLSQKYQSLEIKNIWTNFNFIGGTYETIATTSIGDTFNFYVYFEGDKISDNLKEAYLSHLIIQKYKKFYEKLNITITKARLKIECDNNDTDFQNWKYSNERIFSIYIQLGVNFKSIDDFQNIVNQFLKFTQEENIKFNPKDIYGDFFIDDKDYKYQAKNHPNTGDNGSHYIKPYDNVVISIYERK